MNNATARQTHSPIPNTRNARPPSRPRRTDSTSSEDSLSPIHQGNMSNSKRSPYQVPQDPRAAGVGSSLSRVNVPLLQNFSRPSIALSQNSDQASSRSQSPALVSTYQHQRKHSQGFFEPSLPTASSSIQTNPHSLTASQIAAQAAMQHVRKRSQTTPGPQLLPERPTGRRKPSIPPPIQTDQAPLPLVPSAPSSAFMQHQNHSMIMNTISTAATAASAAYPRTAHASPSFAPVEQMPSRMDRDAKMKPEKSKMKLFSKPKSIGIIKEKDMDRRDKSLPSPNRSQTFGQGSLQRLANASTTSLVDSLASTASTSIYGTANNSTAMLMPMPSERSLASERHRHHFLSRQKNKVKEKEDHYHLPPASATSKSKPLDPAAPQSLYSFSPSSPSPAVTTFAKSMSGLDLRHGGRALREKKKEEKSSAFDILPKEADMSFPGAAEWLGPLSATQNSSFHGPTLAGGNTAYSGVGGPHDMGPTSLQGIGLSGMTPDDAWPFLKARLLVLFEGEDLRLPIEDSNRLVTAHVHRCIQRRVPHAITEDLRDLLETGFSILDHTLRRVPDERLVRSLVDMWIVVFGTILPYLQAIFLPLDLEFKGRGPMMSAREAVDFWGALPNSDRDTAIGDSLDVRRIVLLSYRDTVILPRHDSLQAIFSRLSLDSINGGPSSSSTTTTTTTTATDPTRGASPTGFSLRRPGTAMSLDPGLASFNSQGSTLLGEAALSLGARSRAASSTSSAFGGTAPSLHSSDIPFAPPPPPLANSPQSRTARSPVRPPTRYPPTPTSHPNNQITHSIPPQVVDSAHVTETVGRMLQCVAVLGSVQSADTAQTQMEGLAKILKLNWLGRGRTGRNRRGFVGARVTGPTVATATATAAAAAAAAAAATRDASPTCSRSGRNREHTPVRETSIL